MSLKICFRELYLRDVWSRLRSEVAELRQRDLDNVVLRVIISDVSISSQEIRPRQFAIIIEYFFARSNGSNGFHDKGIVLLEELGLDEEKIVKNPDLYHKDS